MEIKELTVHELRELKDSGKYYFLVDVRGPEEYAYANLDATLIPMQEIPERFKEIPREGMVIVHCHHGGRSKKVIAWLEQAHGYSNLYNLAGGIHAWSEEIDTGVPSY